MAWVEALPPASAPVVTIAPGLTITDSSTSQLTSATVSISQNFSSSEDVLGWDAAVAAANNITVTASPHSHFITLTPTTPNTSAGVAAFQAVLRTAMYTNSSQKPTAFPRTVTFTVVDSNSITSTITSSSQQVVSVTGVNNPPTFTTSEGADAYVVGASPILIDGSLSLSDPDDASLVGATVKITGGYTSGDTLAFNNQGGITGSYSAGVLTLTGTATPLEYQIALRAVTFSTSAAPGLRTISFQADDNATPGTPDGNVATKQVAVSASGSGAGASLPGFDELNASETIATPRVANQLLSTGNSTVELGLQTQLSLLLSQVQEANSAVAPPSSLIEAVDHVFADMSFGPGLDDSDSLLVGVIDGREQDFAGVASLDRSSDFWS